MKIQTLKKRKDFILSNKFAKKCHSKNFILQKYKDPTKKYKFKSLVLQLLRE